MKIILLIFLVLLVSGCAVTYTADPANELKSYTGEICVIVSPDVREEFLIAYSKVLKEKGFSVKTIPSGSSTNTCKLTSTYIGKWSWDFKPYMATAEIIIYENGKSIGSATYSSPRGGWAMTSKIYESTETKIRGMLEKLFPNL